MVFMASLGKFFSYTSIIGCIFFFLSVFFLIQIITHKNFYDRLFILYLIAILLIFTSNALPNVEQYRFFENLEKQRQFNKFSSIVLIFTFVFFLSYLKLKNMHDSRNE